MIGETVHVGARPSLPLLRECNEQQCWDFGRVSEHESGVQGTDTVLLPELVVNNAAEALRNALGLSLFNFDVVTAAPRDTVGIDEAKTDSSHQLVGNERSHRVTEHYVVDVNYFPSFQDVPDRFAVLETHLRRSARP